MFLGTFLILAFHWTTTDTLNQGLVTNVLETDLDFAISPFNDTTRANRCQLGSPWELNVSLGLTHGKNLLFLLVLEKQNNRLKQTQAAELCR